MKTRVISVRGMSRFDRSLSMKDSNFIYVGRDFAGWKDSGYGNIFKAGMTRWEAIAIIRPFLRRPELASQIRFPDRFKPIDAVIWHFFSLVTVRSLRHSVASLSGKTLGCWCTSWSGHDEPPAKPCHAISLAWVANGRSEEEYLEFLEKIRYYI